MALTAPKAFIQKHPRSTSVLFGGVFINGQALGRAQNISQGHISRILSGTRTPSMKAASKIASALGITIDELMENIAYRRDEMDAEDTKAIKEHRRRVHNGHISDARLKQNGKIPRPRPLDNLKPSVGA